MKNTEYKQEKEEFVKDLLANPPKSRLHLEKRKKRFCADLRMKLLRNSDLIEIYRDLLARNDIKRDAYFEKITKKRATRTLSGVATVSVISKPFPCPGRCIFCPTEFRVPKSYLSNEPSVMKAISLKYDPFKQVQMRLKTYENNGHDSDKIELIVQGGTWSYYDDEYKFEFIKRLYDACNAGPHGEDKPAATLAEAQKINETAQHRVVGLTLETRPDYINEKELRQMREFGCTRVEVGVQNIYDDVLVLNKRLHKIDAVIDATKLLKEAGFKINYHMMPNLPGSDVERDYQNFVELFGRPEFQPDMLKIYPCSVLKNAPLYKWFKDGRYTPYTDEELFDLLMRIKKIIPEYTRINRLIRDIPTTSIEAGNMWSNLRQMLQAKMAEQGEYCKCIRCREARDKEVKIDEAILDVQTYEASGGTEYFLSFISPDRKILYAFLRLRLNADNHQHFIDELQGAALIREVHTYGQLAPIADDKGGFVQHAGFGRRLLAKAEEIAREHGRQKMAVISGIGVREYYRKNGYVIDGTYMCKSL